MTVERLTSSARPTALPGEPAGQVRRYRPTGPLDLDATLAPHRRGRFDPCHTIEPDGAHWRTWRTPDGPATLRLAAGSVSGADVGEVDARAWGPGAEWALEGVPALLGEGDDWSGLDLRSPARGSGLLAEVRRRNPGMRLTRSGRVFEALVPAIIEQLVTGVEARRAWARLVTRFGDPAPGPAPERLRVLPEPATMTRITDWEWHALGLDGKRRQAIVRAAHVAGRLDEPIGLDAVAARLISLPGIGAWTVAETLQRSHGAPDLVSIGDYHLPTVVGLALAGRTQTDDAAMLALLEPYRPHRQRVVRLIEASGITLPRRGARMAPRDYRRI